MTPEQIAELEALAEKATPGEWKCIYYDAGDYDHYDMNGPCPGIFSALKAQQPDDAMVERVARALCAADPEVRHGDAEGVVQQRVHIEWRQYAHAARAAIAAMQESRDD